MAPKEITTTSFNSLTPEIIQMISPFVLRGTAPHSIKADSMLVRAIQSGALAFLDNERRAELLKGFTTYKFAYISAMGTASVLCLVNKTTRAQLAYALHKKADMVQKFTHRTLKHSLVCLESRGGGVAGLLCQQYWAVSGNTKSLFMADLGHQMSTDTIFQGYHATLEVAWYRHLADKIEIELL